MISSSHSVLASVLVLDAIKLYCEIIALIILKWFLDCLLVLDFLFVFPCRNQRQMLCIKMSPKNDDQMLYLLESMPEYI